MSTVIKQINITNTSGVEEQHPLGVLAENVEMDAQGTKLSSAISTINTNISNITSTIDDIKDGSIKVGNADKFDGQESSYFATKAVAQHSAAGLMSAADKVKLDGIAPGANAYVLPAASGSVLGGVKVGGNITVDGGGVISLEKKNITDALGFTPASQDTDTKYTAGTGLTLSGNQFNVSFGTTASTVCVGNDSRLSNARPASDVSAWAKAATKPSYTKSEVGLGNVDNTADANKSVNHAKTADNATNATNATNAASVDGFSFSTSKDDPGAGSALANNMVLFVYEE